MRAVVMPLAFAIDGRISFAAKGLMLYIEAASVAGGQELSDEFLGSVGMIEASEFEAIKKQLIASGYARADHDGVYDISPWPEPKERPATVQQPPEITPPPQIVTKHIPHDTRLMVLVRDNFKCRYCTAPTYMLDHLAPRSRGGDNSHENLVACCVSCNSKKGARTPQEAGIQLLPNIRKDSTNGAL